MKEIKFGYIENKNQFEERIENEVIAMEVENIVDVAIEDTPEYSLALINNNESLNEDEILESIKNKATITYVAYAINLNGKEQAVVNTLEEADELVKNMKKEYEDEAKFDIGIKKVYTQDLEDYKTVTVAKAEKKVSKQIEKIADASINKVYLAQKPVEGTITSRFGNRESIRTHAHTGLDIAAPYGTDIKAASEGKVTWTGAMGSYGNLVIISCGNGVEMYYGHCSKIYAKEGQKVKAGDVIAAVGSTGNSTGNHLHFEIRVNGTRVNPQNYIYK